MTYYPDDHPAFDVPEFNPEPIEEEFPIEPDIEYKDGERHQVYDIHDPKGPKYHSTHADIWDQREGK